MSRSTDERETRLRQAIGMPLAQLESPALVLRHDVLLRNLDSMAGFAAAHGIKLRPHAKAHKSVRIAAMQIERGAVGVCVQKLSEAEALAAGGITNIFLSNEVVNRAKLARVIALARKITLSVTVDSEAGIALLADVADAAGVNLDVLVEVDIGQSRCGTEPENAGLLAAQLLRRGLRFAGLHAYQGKAQHIAALLERETAVAAANAKTALARHAVEAQGIACPLITGGGTGTFAIDARNGIYDEIQPGSYVFMDRDYQRIEAAPADPVFGNTLFVKSEVISTAPAHAVVDAGHKAHAIDSGMPAVWGRQLEYLAGGDEHGVLSGPQHEMPALGECVWLIPGHCDPTVNLYDYYVVVEGDLENGTVIDIWPIEARGCLT